MLSCSSISLDEPYSLWRTYFLSSGMPSLSNLGQEDAAQRTWFSHLSTRDYQARLINFPSSPSEVLSSVNTWVHRSRTNSLWFQNSLLKSANFHPNFPLNLGTTPKTTLCTSLSCFPLWALQSSIFSAFSSSSLVIPQGITAIFADFADDYSTGD